MNKPRVSSLVGIIIPTVISTILCIVVGSDGNTLIGLPIFSLCVGLAFTLQWVIFIPSYLYKTEKFFDLTGSATYLLLVSMALITAEAIQMRSLLIGVLISVWAIRLGGFLFTRVQSTGHDSRFTTLKTNFLTFLMVWTLQGLWITLTIAAGLCAMTSETQQPLGVYSLVGFTLWVLGFGIEVTADKQKKAFRSRLENERRFITHGLWAWSRHPNYFGEILLWTGIAIIAFPTLAGSDYVTLISPVFVWLLLSKLSGIPLLEKQAMQRWGTDPEYLRYKSNTPVLIPNIFRHYQR
ncbi:MAG: hypothetical protein CL793_05665 [Chloroflexi bacterium]|nr:hypothetical protein [Chloroflexota bacterium]|tara:strand:- start:1717 stop:2601 length:885 start_codon:yes stop_codon:yes gene_type:complete